MKPRSQSLVDMFPYRQNASRCPLCVICGVELRRMDGLPRRKEARYCSGRCRDEAWIRAGMTATIRQLLEERDKGVCSDCGIDCLALEKAFSMLNRPWDTKLYYRLPPKSSESWQDLDLLARRIRAAFVARTRRLGWSVEQHTWEAHHVVPVVEGGGGCDLKGYATLCLRCHKRASAELAARRAAQGAEAEPAGQIPLPFA